MRTALLIFALLVSTASISAQPRPATRTDTRPGTRPATRPSTRPATPSLTAEQREELSRAAKHLGDEIAALRTELKGQEELLALLPDIQIYHNALRYPATYNDLCDFRKVRPAYEAGLARVKQLRERKPAWTRVSGPRGYVSRIDGSVQPYHLAVPPTYRGERPEGSLGWPAGAKQRLDIFCHGRDENLTELNFIAQKSPASETHFLLHPYGRYCNANKFAGEVDVFEALDDARKRYPIDERRVVMTGFSMGGAAAWHLTVHHPHKWVASSPGAGFAETPRYAKIKDGAVPAYERTLFRMYDCDLYAANLGHVPTIAYAGELDPQIQASDVMLAAAKGQGAPLERIIGPQTRHEYNKESKRELDARLTEIASKKKDLAPRELKFTTYTLRYNQAFYLKLEGLERHWEPATVEVKIGDDSASIVTKNVTALALEFDPAHNPFKKGVKPALTIDGQRVEAEVLWKSSYTRIDGKWKSGAKLPEPRKKPGLQGPIDDAFMGPFMIVRPSGAALNDKVGQWAKRECDEAIEQWRRQFRGEPRVKLDIEVTKEDIAEYNLIVFGDPSSNAVLTKAAGGLPIKWDKEAVTVGKQTYPAAHHVPVMIHPNPLSAGRYIVVNSGFTFREWPVSNARQTPKLPDFAVFDISTAATKALPGNVVTAGFFDEQWKVQR